MVTMPSPPSHPVLPLDHIFFPQHGQPTVGRIKTFWRAKPLPIAIVIKKCRIFARIRISSLTPFTGMKGEEKPRFEGSLNPDRRLIIMLCNVGIYDRFRICLSRSQLFLKSVVGRAERFINRGLHPLQRGCDSQGENRAESNRSKRNNQHASVSSALRS